MIEVEQAAMWPIQTASSCNIKQQGRKQYITNIIMKGYSGVTCHIIKISIICCKCSNGIREA